MALTGEIKKGENPQQEDKFLVTFTNGTVQQLKDLADFLQKEEFSLPTEESERLIAVLKVGIGWLEKIKEEKMGGNNSSH